MATSLHRRFQRRKTMRGEPPTEAQRLENVFRKKFPPCCRAGDAVDACLCVTSDGAGFMVYGLPGGKTECAVIIMRLWRSLSVTGLVSCVSGSVGVVRPLAAVVICRRIILPVTIGIIILLVAQR